MKMKKRGRIPYAPRSVRECIDRHIRRWRSIEQQEKDFESTKALFEKAKISIDALQTVRFELFGKYLPLDREEEQ